MNELTESMVKTIKSAAKKMTGANRRAFEAEAALDYLAGQRQVWLFEFKFSVFLVGRI